MRACLHAGRQCLWALLAPALLIASCALTLACSESDDETAVEYSNWQSRNEAFFATLADSLAADPANWVRLKSFSKNTTLVEQASDFVYAKIIERGEGTESPYYNDSVRVSYQGRLLPSTTYAQGYIFDSTVYGAYSSKTNATVKFLLSGLISGWCTALQHMHRGDYWRIYIPYQLGYGASGSGSIPGYSLLIFDVTLVDFSHPGEAMPSWNARRMR